MDQWRDPPAELKLPEGELHMWRASVDVHTRVAGCLDARERDRIARLRFERDRIRYTAAHGALRHILALYLAADPAGIRFVAGPHGKPYLAGGDLQFNLSDSGDFALVAVARGREVGVDIELVRERRELDRIAARYFTPEECQEDFYRVWTRKEALFKAAGIGLRGLGSPPDPSRWRVVGLSPADGYAGAVAFEARPPDPRLELFAF